MLKVDTKTVRSAGVIDRLWDPYDIGRVGYVVLDVRLNPQP